jgi:hypothetical protein
MPFRLRILLSLLIMLTILAASAVAQEKAQTAVSDSVSSDTTAKPLPWLHVEVETSYGWFWQKSTGIAYTTVSRDSKQLVKVGKLCVQLVAHDTTTKCIENADSVVIFEKKSGVAIPKKIAYVAAWTEDPKLDTLRVHLAP